MQNFGYFFSNSSIQIPKMSSATIFFAVLAMYAMVNAAPVQEDDKKNLQGLFDVLARQKDNKESAVQAATSTFWGELLRHGLRFATSCYADMQQDDDNGNQAEAQFLGKLLKHAIKFAWQANKQQDDDTGNQAEAQFFGKLLKHAFKYAKYYDANIQQDDGGEKAEAQFWGFLARNLIKHAAGHGINYAMNKLG